MFGNKRLLLLAISSALISESALNVQAAFSPSWFEPQNSIQNNNQNNNPVPVITSKPKARKTLKPSKSASPVGTAEMKLTPSPKPIAKNRRIIKKFPEIDFSNDSDLPEDSFGMFSINMGPETLPTMLYMEEFVCKNLQRMAQKREENNQQRFYEAQFLNNNRSPVKQISRPPSRFSSISQNSNNFPPHLVWQGPSPTQISSISNSSSNSPMVPPGKRLVKKDKSPVEDLEKDYMCGGFPGSEGDPFAEDEESEYELVSVKDSDEEYEQDSDDEDIIKLPNGVAVYKPMINPELAKKLQAEDEFFNSYNSNESSQSWSSVFRDVGDKSEDEKKEDEK